MLRDGLTILGLRHGEVHNPDGVLYSSLPNFFLSDAGRREAAEAAERLRRAGVVAIYSSPLDRAQETARYLADATGAEVTTDDRLIEWKHWEQWAGLRWEDITPEDLERYMNDPGAVTSGESLAELADRMEAWMSDARRDHTSGVVVGVCHLEPLRAVLLRLTGRPATDLFAMEIGHCGLVRLSPDPSSEPLEADVN